MFCYFKQCIFRILDKRYIVVNKFKSFRNYFTNHFFHLSRGSSIMIFFMSSRYCTIIVIIMNLNAIFYCDVICINRIQSFFILNDLKIFFFLVMNSNLNFLLCKHLNAQFFISSSSHEYVIIYFSRFQSKLHNI